MGHHQLEQRFHPDGLADFRIKTTFWIAISGTVCLVPVAANNMWHGNVEIGFGAVAVIAVLVHLAWVSFHGRYTDAALLLVPPVVAFLGSSVWQQEIIGVMWTYPAVVCFYFILREHWAWAANVLIGLVVVPLSFSVLDLSIALRVLSTLAVVSVFSIMAVRVIGVQQKRLETMAVTDPLTGLYNRSLLTFSLDAAVHRMQRNGEPATLMTLDIDHFKHINDTYGHQVGDEVLAGIAALLKRRLRQTDVIFRTGGEEFCVLLPDTGGEPGQHVAQLLRSAIAGENLIDTCQVTVSVGVAALTSTDTNTSWMARADSYLYEAKHQGRNRVCSDTPLTAERRLPG